MQDKSKSTSPAGPAGDPPTSRDVEEKLRARVSAASAGSTELWGAQWQLMRFLSMTGQFSESFSILETLLNTTSNPETRAEIVLATGQTFEHAGDFQSAIAAYSRGVALEPVGERVWYLLHNNLGYSLNQVGRASEAEGWCRAAIQINPLRHNAHKNLGVACQAQSRYAEAARSFIEAVRREARDPRALRHLEALVKDHPEIATEIPDIGAQVAKCVEAVRAAYNMMRAEPPPDAPKSG